MYSGDNMEWNYRDNDEEFIYVPAQVIMAAQTGKREDMAVAVRGGRPSERQVIEWNLDELQVEQVGTRPYEEIYWN